MSALRILVLPHPADRSLDVVRLYVGDDLMGEVVLARGASWLERRSAVDRLSEMLNKNSHSKHG